MNTLVRTEEGSPKGEHELTNVKPNCYDCVHQRDLAGDCHSSCANKAAHVTGDAHGIRKGWFMWPHNFDPVWLVNCDGFTAKAEKKRNEP